MNNPVHVITLAVTIRATAALKTGTFVRYSGGYTGTAPMLGVVLMDAEAGQLASVGVRGLYQVKVATGVTFAPGDKLAIDANGVGVTPAAATTTTAENPGIISVLEYVPQLATVII